MSSLINHPLSIIYHGLVKPDIEGLIAGRLTQVEMVKRWHVGPKAVRDILDEENIPSGRKTRVYQEKNALSISAALLEYPSSESTLKAIAKKHGLDARFFYRMLKKHKIHIRSSKETNYPHIDPETSEKAVAMFKEGKSITSIRKILCLSKPYLYSMLRGAKLLASRYVKSYPDAYVEKDHGDQRVGRINRWLIGNIYHSAKVRDQRSRVTTKDLEVIFRQQNGLCYYTGIKLATVRERNVKNPFLVSVDRLDASGEYALDNIVLCCMFVNYAKNEWDVNTFVKMLDAVRTNRPVNSAQFL